MSGFSQNTSVSNATSTPAASGGAAASSAVTINGVRLPSAETLLQAVKLAAVEDRPIMMDYWVNSIEKKAMIGVREGTKEKLLVKSEEEYTSPIGSLFKVGNEYIVLTENSIYIVDTGIPLKKISA